MEALLASGELSRAELVQATGLSRATLSRLAAELLAAGVLVEAPGPPGPGRGRVPRRLGLAGRAGLVGALAFGDGELRAALGDAGGLVLAEQRVDLPVGNDAAAALDVAAGLLGELLASRADRSEGALARVVMGLPCSIDERTGRVSYNDMLPGWLGLARRLSSPAGAGARWTATYYPTSDFTGTPIGTENVTSLDVATKPAIVGSATTWSVTYTATMTLPTAVQDLFGLTAGAAATLKVGGQTITSYTPGTGSSFSGLASVPAGTPTPFELGASGRPFLEGLRDSLDRYAQPATAAAVNVTSAHLGLRAEGMGAVGTAISHSGELTVTASMG